MRVFNSTIGRVKDGQLEAAVGVAAEAAKVVGRHGGDIRFYVAGAGAEINSTLFSIEYESPEALGRAFDALGADTEVQAFMARVDRAQLTDGADCAGYGHGATARAYAEGGQGQHPRSPLEPDQSRSYGRSHLGSGRGVRVRRSQRAADQRGPGCSS